MPIRDCLDKDTEAFLDGKRVRAFEQCAKQANKAITKLQAAEQLIDLRSPPSNNFKAMGGDRKGQYSIRIDDKWRLCFRWEPRQPVPEGTDAMMVPGDPCDVEITNHYD